MTDSALWVSALTGGTAVLASWVTSRGTARAARIQAQASAAGQQRQHIRETRRSAYADLMEQAHVTGELYYRVGDAYVRRTDPVGQIAFIDKLRDDLRDAFDPLTRCVRIILLEGPPGVATAAESLRDSAAASNGALWRVSLGEPGAREAFDEAHRAFLRALDGFIAAAHLTLSES